MDRKTKKALIVGIDNYDNCGNLSGCVLDAKQVAEMLKKNGDRSPNFNIQLLTSDDNQRITTSLLKDKINDFFENSVGIDTCLFYFAGHGTSESDTGYICTSEVDNDNNGVSFTYIMSKVKQSKANNNIIILDSCSSGHIGGGIYDSGLSELPEGTTILTACEKDRYSLEDNNGGVFTNLMLDALSGSAGNLLGQITASSIYSHIDQSLGDYTQRPIFKTNVRNFACIRTTSSFVVIDDLYDLVALFPTADTEYKLDPTFEPDLPDTEKEKFNVEPIKENTEIFALLQKFNRVNLIVPTEEEHMYYAALHSKSCHLTILGKHYWNLVKENKI